MKPTSGRFFHFMLTAIGLAGCGIELPTQQSPVQQRGLAGLSQYTQPLIPSTHRHGMTWNVVEQRGSYVLVGSDAQTNAYLGDTFVDSELPVLCLNKDGRAAPSGFTFDFYHGWASGDVKLTAPLPGSVLVSVAAADAACARSFGKTYRMAEFHDGGGGWNWWAQGVLGTTSRFWVAITDQPANPWNSTGELPDPPYQESVLDTGVDWQLLNVSGYAVDDSSQPYDANIYVIQNASGASHAPLPAGLQAELSGETGSADTVFVVDQSIAKEITTAEATGKLTPALSAIAEPLDPPLRGPEAPGTPGSTERLFGRCKDRSISKSKTFSNNTPVSNTFALGSGFTGNVTINGGVQVSATGEVHLALKRYAIFGFCVPYGIKFENAHAYGSAVVTSDATLNGTVSYANPTPWEKQLAKPYLFSLNFLLGPVPVHIGFNLPITLGVELQASVTGSVGYAGSQIGSGSFDYTCTLDTCSGATSFSLSSSSPPPTLVGSVSGRIQPSVYAQAAVRAYLYDEKLAYAQLGIRPALQGDLWGYWGTTCGDADEDGSPETVKALTFDLDWQMFITSQTSVLGADPKRHDDIWHTKRSHIGWWDLAGSTALRPILSGLATPPVNWMQPYSGRMRPCWPYTDNVNYQLAWEDGTTSSFTGPPGTPTSASHVWSKPGAKTLGLTAQRDAHGRVLNQTTTRTVQAVNATWTSWLNRDDPSASGDWELLSEFVKLGQACAKPFAVQCQTTGGVDWARTGQVYACSLEADGGICQNANNPAGCLDYQVRFLCP